MWRARSTHPITISSLIHCLRSISLSRQDIKRRTKDRSQLFPLFKQKDSTPITTYLFKLRYSSSFWFLRDEYARIMCLPTSQSMSLPPHLFYLNKRDVQWNRTIISQYVNYRSIITVLRPIYNAVSLKGLFVRYIQRTLLLYQFR